MACSSEQAEAQRVRHWCESLLLKGGLTAHHPAHSLHVSSVNSYEWQACSECHLA